MKNRKIQMGIMIIVMILFIVLIRNNVIAKKESPTNRAFSDSALVLEISSDVVQNVYSKLTLIDDNIKSPTYKDMYFDFEEEEKTLSIEEKLYSMIENIYQNKTYPIEENDGIYKLKLTRENIIKESNDIFGETLDFTNIDYKVDRNCGVVGLSYLEGEYDIQIKECNSKKNFTKTKIYSAIKDGNYIYAHIKAFRAYTTKNNIDENKKIYSIKNFNSNDLILKSSYNEINENEDKIFENYDIDEYLFVFELRGDGYFLDKIIREKRD